MKKFKYRLQALLKMKEHIEKERQKMLAASAKQVQDQETRLELVENHRDDTIERQRDDASGRFTVAEMLVISRYLHKLKRESILGQELLKALKKEEDVKRQELLEATREKKKYEKLKEVQDRGPKTWDQLNRHVYLDYGTYAKFRGKINKLEVK